MTLTEYKKLLANLDPYFGYSDDYSAYKRGQQAWKVASDIAKREQGVYKDAWNAYNDSLK